MIMKHLFLALALLSFGGGVHAQNRTTSPEPTSQEANKACEVPDMQAVKNLNLNESQLVKIREIHADIERECAAVRDESGMVDADIMTRHQARIKDVLTPSQYEEYVTLGKAERKVKGTRDVKGESRTVN
jgi:Spy/CpxP family protein refolding chaperone